MEDNEKQKIKVLIRYLLASSQWKNTHLSHIMRWHVRYYNEHYNIEATYCITCLSQIQKLLELC